jgi:hypothetical protein
MSTDYPISEADETSALQLVGWIVSDSVRADRMLGLTGLTPDDLRGALGDRATLGALMDFVINHEPDLLACAEALGVTPAALVAVRGRIGPRNDW